MYWYDSKRIICEAYTFTNHTFGGFVLDVEGQKITNRGAEVVRHKCYLLLLYISPVFTSVNTVAVLKQCRRSGSYY